MKKLNIQDVQLVSGGEYVHGEPTPDMLCFDTRLMIMAGRGEAGFDVSAAVHSLMKYCGGDFWDPNEAHEYVMSGAYP
ncbi:MAG: hypothetical protein JSR17_06305 [Proteobacteria bacterium]|nr:hypothetical protein [Pseudomonadota bacterium]